MLLMTQKKLHLRPKMPQILTRKSAAKQKKSWMEAKQTFALGKAVVIMMGVRFFFLNLNLSVVSVLIGSLKELQHN